MSDRAATMSPEVPLRTWMAIVGASLGAFMAVLNIQIVGASLDDIRGDIHWLKEAPSADTLVARFNHLVDVVNSH